MANIGKVVQVIGPVLDIEFPDGTLPPILNAVRVKDDGKQTGVPIDLIAEVAQHLGENRVRAVSMKTTDGMHARDGGRQTSERRSRCRSARRRSAGS